MNVPNFLTILRILAIPVFTICLIYGYIGSALLIFLGAGVTDGLDGLIARVWHQKTTLGAYLDPIADKLLISTSFIVLAVLGIIPSWLTVIVIARDVIIMLGILVLIITYHKIEINPTRISKLTTVFQLMTITCALLIPYILFIKGFLPYLAWVTAFFTCFSGLQYIYIGTKFFNEKEAHNVYHPRHRGPGNS